MELLEAIMLRHSVRAFEDKKIEGPVRERSYSKRSRNAIGKVDFICSLSWMNQRRLTVFQPTMVNFQV